MLHSFRQGIACLKIKVTDHDKTQQGHVTVWACSCLDMPVFLSNSQATEARCSCNVYVLGLSPRTTCHQAMHRHHARIWKCLMMTLGLGGSGADTGF